MLQWASWWSICDINKGLVTRQGCSTKVQFHCCRSQMNFGIRRISGSHTPPLRRLTAHSMPTNPLSDWKHGPNSSDCHSRPSAILSPQNFPILTRLSGVPKDSSSLCACLPKPDIIPLLFFLPSNLAWFSPSSTMKVPLTLCPPKNSPSPNLLQHALSVPPSWHFDTYHSTLLAMAKD